ncbi:hypothetical protein J4G37_49535, partial [Microvirga sp. 3-52]|nr:hypothetical protein [Microvirga sp. 3-52]
LLFLTSIAFPLKTAVAWDRAISAGGGAIHEHAAVGTGLTNTTRSTINKNGIRRTLFFIRIPLFLCFMISSFYKETSFKVLKIKLIPIEEKKYKEDTD